MEPTIIFDNVSKKFSKGYVSDSLRDAFAAAFKRFFSRNKRFEPGEPAKQVKPVKLTKQGKDEFWALKDVSFEVKPGEALGIIGPNGSGKSTTLKLLSRILRPDGGKIFVKGRVSALIELGSGFHPDLTGRENVFLNASILGMSKEEITKKYDEIVDFAELHEFMDTPVKWYSSGMYARLGFSVAAHTDPQILLIDEVLSVGDFAFQKKCFDKMKSFRLNGITIVFVSHNLKAVSAICDRVLLLIKGGKVFLGKPHEAIATYLKTNSISHRENTEDVFLEEGKILDDSGTESYTFISGEKAKLELFVRFTKPFKNTRIGIKVFTTKDQNSVFATDYVRLGKSFLTVKINQTIHVIMRLTLNLAPGEYELRGLVFVEETGECVLSQTFANIVIQEDPRFAGIAYLEPELIELAVR